MLFFFTYYRPFDILFCSNTPIKCKVVWALVLWAWAERGEWRGKTGEELEKEGEREAGQGRVWDCLTRARSGLLGGGAGVYGIIIPYIDIDIRASMA